MDLKNRLLHFLLLTALFVPDLVKSQNLYRQAPISAPTESGVFGAAPLPPDADWGAFPFTKDDSALMRAYGQSKFNTVRTVCLSMFVSSWCENADALSYIPKSNWFYATLGFSLTQTTFGTVNELKPSTANDVTLQSLLNNGGNISLGFSKPIYYYGHLEPSELSQWPDRQNSFILSGVGSFLYVIPRFSIFSDIPYLDPIFGGSGARFDIRADYQILNFDSINKGSYLFSIGVRADLGLNQFFSGSSIARDLRRTAIGIGEFYAGVACFEFNLDYNQDLTHTNIFKGRELLYKISIVPLDVDF